MLGKFWRFLALAAVLAVPATVVGTEQLGLSPVPKQGVVLLRNGQTIEGKITRVGELIYVTFPNGEIRLKLSKVEFCCRDLEEGYRRKRAAMQLGNVRDHLAMVQWCLMHGLLDHAAAELSDATAADASHPMIGVLSRRLKMATRPPSKPSGPAESATPSPSFEELDRLVRRMPAGAVETFTDTIQPMLVNNCTAAGCHGPQSASEFRLIRIPKDRPPSRRTTQRNLHATLQWVDRRKPDDSKLLAATTGPHGTADTPVFGRHRAAQYQRFLDWIRQVAEQDQPCATAVAPKSSEPSIVAPSVKRGAQIEQFTPFDPFDPEIFNRRYFGGK